LSDEKSTDDYTHYNAYTFGAVEPDKSESRSEHKITVEWHIPHGRSAAEHRGY
jgi:hypothetical protein